MKKNTILFCLVVFLSCYGKIFSQNTPTRANDFIESIGVCTHFAFSDQPYETRYEETKKLLGDLGIRYIRERAVIDGERARGRVWDLYNTYGIRTIGTFGKKYYTNAEITTKIDEVVDFTDAIIAFEGANEADAGKSGVGSWVDALRANQLYIYNTVKNHTNANINSIPVIAPSPTFPKGVPWMGAMDEIADLYNIHSYHGFRMPESIESHFLKYLDSIPKTNANDLDAPSKIIATEAGYHNEWRSTSGVNNGVSELAESKYLPRMLFYYFQNGIKQTYIYELLDHLAETPYDNQDNFGMIRYDFTPKASYKAVKNLISVLQDNNADFTVSNLNYSLTGANASTQQFLLQKGDGTHYLVLWQAIESWDNSSNTDIINSDHVVTVNFGSAIPKVNVIDPAISTGYYASYDNVSSVDVAVKDQIVILEIGNVSRSQMPVASFTMDVKSGLSPLTVNFDASTSNDPNGGDLTYAWEFESGATSDQVTASHTFIADSKTTKFVVKLTVANTAGDEAFVTDTVTAQVIQFPYLGAPKNLPGTLEAENYDLGGEGISYHDVDTENVPGDIRDTSAVDIAKFLDADDYYITNIQNDEWIEFTVNASIGSNYSLEANLASADATGQFEIAVNGVVATDIYTVASTGGLDQFETVKYGSFNINEGINVIKVHFITGGFNLNNITLSTDIPPIMHWAFEGDTTDETGLNNATMIGDEVYSTDAAMGVNSLSFNGADNVLNITHTKLSQEIDSRTVAFWIKAEETNSKQVIYDEGGANNGIAMRIIDNTIEATVHNGSDITILTAPYNSSDWTHIALIYGNSKVALFLNTIKVDESACASSVASHANLAGLGGRNSADSFGNSGSANAFKGLIDDTYIFDIAIPYAYLKTLSGIEPVNVSSITINTNVINLVIDGTQQLTATVLPANASIKSYTFKTNNPAIATVSSSGLVTGIAEGKAYIIVTSAEGDYTDFCEVWVTKTTAIDDQNTESISVYPIPAEDVLYINGATTGKYVIYGIDGSMQMQGLIQSQINIESLKSGMYIMNIETNNQRKVVRLVVQ